MKLQHAFTCSYCGKTATVKGDYHYITEDKRSVYVDDLVQIPEGWSVYEVGDEELLACATCVVRLCMEAVAKAVGRLTEQFALALDKAMRKLGGMK